MRRKRIMVLGGNAGQAEAILKAKQLGYYVISTDLHEDNPGHKLADEYSKIDIIDRRIVLQEAERLQIDGIMPYCSDTLATVAAYVAEEMNLPGNPYQSVRILTHKDLFRNFLRANGFATPESRSFEDSAEAKSFLKEITSSGKAAIMKPVDSASSKGVFRIRNEAELAEHWDYTMSFSASRRIIIEEFIERTGNQFDGDVFLHQGRIVFAGSTDQFQTNSHSPFSQTAHCCPSSLPTATQKEAMEQLQRLFGLLKMRTGPFNVEYIQGVDGRIYFLDIGPRNGGLKVPRIQEISTGFPELECTIRAAVGDPLPCFQTADASQSKRFTAAMSAFANSEGRYRSLWMSETLRSHVCEVSELVKPGEMVRPPRHGVDAAAFVCALFESKEQMYDVVSHPENHLRVELL